MNKMNYRLLNKIISYYNSSTQLSWPRQENPKILKFNN